MAQPRYPAGRPAPRRHPRRRWETLGLIAALGLTFTVLVVLGTVNPSSSNSGSTPTSPTPLGSSGDHGSAPPPAWMHKLAPGEKPPQFVLFSFDGAGSHEHWQRVLPLAAKVNAHFSGFLSGIYLLTDDQRTQYTGPGHQPGRASIGFGGSAQDVRTRIDDLNKAIDAGNEIGTHYNGHFCQGSEPSVGRWSTAQWNDELDQFLGYVKGAAAQGLRVDPAAVKGGRTPCLEGRFDQLMPSLVAHGMDYDTSQVSDGIAWPEQQNGVWEFFMPTVAMAGTKHKVIMMDYNLWYALNKAQDDASRSDEFSRITLDTYRGAYAAALAGNRAPLVVGNHFNDWAGSAFSKATEQFMGEVCTKPETACATYSEVIQWLGLQDPAVLASLRKQPHAFPA